MNLLRGAESFPLHSPCFFVAPGDARRYQNSKFVYLCVSFRLGNSCYEVEWSNSMHFESREKAIHEPCIHHTRPTFAAPAMRIP